MNERVRKRKGERVKNEKVCRTCLDWDVVVSVLGLTFLLTVNRHSVEKVFFRHISHLFTLFRIPFFYCTELDFLYFLIPPLVFDTTFMTKSHKLYPPIYFLHLHPDIVLPPLNFHLEKNSKQMKSFWSTTRHPPRKRWRDLGSQHVRQWS